MELELRRGGRTARIDTKGAELVSYRDEDGLEYIWGGDPAYWAGRNPLLFPVVGNLRDGKVTIGGKEYAMERHGFARRQEFAVAEQGEDWARLELTDSPETLAMYPFPFRLAVEQRLTDGGFATAVTVTNTGTAPMPFCLGAHTGFRCPLAEGSGSGLRAPLPSEGDLQDPGARRGGDGLEPHPALPGGHRHPASGLPLVRRPGHPDLPGPEVGIGASGEPEERAGGGGVLPRLAHAGLLDRAPQAGPLPVHRAWHGCSAVAGEGPELADKAFCITLAPGESRTLSYQVATL